MFLAILLCAANRLKTPLEILFIVNKSKTIIPTVLCTVIVCTYGGSAISRHFARDFRHQKLLFFFGHNARLTNRVGNYNLHG